MLVEGKVYKITVPEEHFIDQNGYEDSFPEIVRLVKVLDTRVKTPNGNTILARCLYSKEQYPLPIKGNYLVELVS